MKYLLKVRILSAVYICINQDLKIVCPYLFYFEKQGAQMFNLQYHLSLFLDFCGQTKISNLSQSIMQVRL